MTFLSFQTIHSFIHSDTFQIQIQSTTIHTPFLPHPFDSNKHSTPSPSNYSDIASPSPPAPSPSLPSPRSSSPILPSPPQSSLQPLFLPYFSLHLCYSSSLRLTRFLHSLARLLRLLRFASQPLDLLCLRALLVRHAHAQIVQLALKPLRL